MSARTLSRRPRLVAAVTVAAAVCGTALLPAAAHADAPADKPLGIAFSAPSPSGPLVRGGATESDTVSATNNNDKALDFSPNILGIPVGGSPLDGSEVKLAVVPVTAPATDVAVGSQGPSVVLTLRPHGEKFSRFSIPAKATYTWKVTVGLNANFPSNDGNLTLTFDTGSSENSPSHPVPAITFQASPAIRIGTITDRFGGDTQVSAAKPAVFSLDVDNQNGGGHYDKALRTELTAFGGRRQELNLFVWLSGRWVEVAAPDRVNTWLLPDIPAGFAGDQTYHYKLKFTVPEGKEPTTATVLNLGAKTALSSGNTSIITSVTRNLTVLPGGPATTPAGTPSSTPSAKPTPSASSTTSSPVPTASATTDAPVNTKGSLAHTGANGSNGTLAAGAGVLVALGAALAFVGLRRRRNLQG
ncbi:LPXTG cell wall anchor domain-containing protein [Streptomyces sp. H39-S7]|uniref:LPXTG cell wall anchor domain-containing protein n=1 Tax=Streptomyces sp. H39-S7 TaxID=3004357 RepID=UPI0022AF0CD4|nr:LPXTG cell wall anchor domain-containing protein [Streptomyces sp. H39-S7]MCZ4125068.1 LPXTG cell wall anchor domain-containing protein [Streptomyces sp. H39-S7]